MTRQPSSISGTGGYTLLELIAALVVLGILTSIAAPKLGGVVRGSKLQGVADQINADLAYARILAVRSGRSASLCFNAADRRVYQVVTGTCAAVTATRKRQDLRSGSAGVSVSVAQGSTALTEISFNSRGMLTGAGTVKLTAAQQGKTAVVELSPLGKTTRTY
jgi:prepilin-type N-terminal cleavage/methylation domain-containing protein